MTFSSTDEIPDVAIVGAGPYGLSLAAHLRARGLKFRIFGTPMKTWRDHMPPGMLLKSDGFASNLSDPVRDYTLDRFCRERGEPYAGQGRPVPLGTFVDYGIAFQKRMVPELEVDWVTGIAKNGEGYELTLRNGGQARARRVVLAIGITFYAYVPPELARLGAERVIHTADCCEGERFRGKKVAIIGAGSSAMDTAALLHESGAEVTVIARSPNIYFGEPPSGRPRPLWQRIRHPTSGIGSSLRSRIYCDAPWLFHMLPQSLRLRIVKRHLGPHSGWPLRERVLGRVAMLPGTVIKSAEPDGAGVSLTLAGADGAEKTHYADFIVTGTGYRVDIEKLPFLSAGLRARDQDRARFPAALAEFRVVTPGALFHRRLGGELLRAGDAVRFRRRLHRAHARQAPRGTFASEGTRLSADPAPAVLLAATERFVFPARLAMALAGAGFPVEAVCPKGHALASTGIVKRLHRYKILRGISSFKTAILKANPALIIPCDDLARDHLHRLHETGNSAR